MLPKAGLTVCHYAINFQDTGVGRKERVVLFWMPATRGECRLVSKNQLPIAAQETKVFKGEFQGGMDRGRGQDGIVISDSHLNISDMAANSASSLLFIF